MSDQISSLDGQSDDISHEENTWSIGTYLRLKPSHEKRLAKLISYENNVARADNGDIRATIDIEIPPNADPGLVHNNDTGKIHFEFDGIFDTATGQEAIFETVAHQKVLDAIDGINCTIFAYGQTGSGKTYTMFGGETYVDRGIIPRSLSLIFEQIRKRTGPNEKFQVELSFTEVYKESVYDLLDQTKRHQTIEQWSAVQVLESETGLVLRNVNVFEVDDEESALNLFFMGNANRVTIATAMNNVSSRSHAVFTIVIRSELLREGKRVYTSGKINLVDLAGSERMYKMNNSKGALSEARSINLSLHFLEQVVISLREAHQQLQQTNSRRHIPYRNSILTNMLRDSLGGNCRSCFILMLSIEKFHFEETISTCRFGQRCGEIKLAVHANAEIGLADQLKEMTLRVKSLEKQIQLLEEQRRGLMNLLEAERAERKQASTARTLTNEEKAECKSCVQALLAAAKESITVAAKRSDGEDAAGGGEIAAEAKKLGEAIIERSQDDLYRAVEKMDKSILLELSTALGGLVQAMYVEREKAKQAEAARLAKKSAIKQQKEAKSREDSLGTSTIATAASSGESSPTTQQQQEQQQQQQQHQIVLPSPAVGQVLGGDSEGAATPIPVSAATPAVISSVTGSATGSSAHQTPPRPARSNPNAAASTVPALHHVSTGSSSDQGVAQLPTAVSSINTNGSNLSSFSLFNSTTGNNNNNNNNSNSSTTGQQSLLGSLSSSTIQMLKTGASFLKHSRGLFGSKNARHVFLSNDLRDICWRQPNSQKPPTVVPLDQFFTVTVGNLEDKTEKSTMTLKRKGGGSAGHLVLQAMQDDAHALITRWVDALSVCIMAATHHNMKTSV